MHSALQSILAYIHGDGLAILPEMELLLFALGILIFDFLLEAKEKHLNAWLALLGVVASSFGLFQQIKRYNVERTNPMHAFGLLGFHNTVLVDGFFIIFAALFLAATALGLSLQPVSQLLEIDSVRVKFSQLFRAGGVPLMTFRLGYADTPPLRTPRRPLEDVLL